MDNVMLLEPDGTENIITSMRSAIEYCHTHPGWSWRHLTSEESARCI